ncbi:DNA-directed RNA polymerase [Penicillium argentinense]|uniref:DNA-directed RNA polymerases I, II, and III subunit RPABC3 n=1 Tax=Penicillium argentinense TaxID=1131581 RepID=A0A9W9FEB5_9EURO|nr:DNA-directed RNA polymerase [Penicillium argentinense]KAJ5098332.1 DNA-directed RNA polymerase [Penicillium argentinense]
MSDPLLFEDTFTVTSVNQQKYDRVSRITCSSTDATMSFTLDINTDLYPCAVNETLSLALASTLSLDGKEDARNSWRNVADGDQTLANEYDYVCHGKVYRFEEGATKDTMAVFVSFGGLLLYLEGPYKKLVTLRIDHVYLLLKK